MFGRRRKRNSQDDYTSQRIALVETIRASAQESGTFITEAALDAIARVPRERFAPRSQASEAYEDRALPIGLGQTLSQPTMVAWMTSLLNLSGNERVLEIGTGSGYQAYILSAMLPSGNVTTIERHLWLARRAQRRLQAFGVGNVEVIAGDGSSGYAPRAPYDRILVTAGAPFVPDTLIEQLSAGGRIVVPAGARDLQELLTVDKDASGAITTQGHGRCVFVPLIGEAGWSDEA